MDRTHRWAALLLAAAAAACDGGGTEGTGPDVESALEMRITTGDAQQGLPGETLPVPLTVTLTRADGTPAAGVAVTFAAAAGSLEVVAGTTTADGVAFAWWTLPAVPAGELSVRAEAPRVQPVTFRAGRLPADRTDLVFTRQGGPVNLLIYNAFEQSGYAAGFRARFADSLLMRPFDTPRDFNEVFAFTPDRAPLVTPVAWTAARDSVQLVFRETVVLPVTIWVVKAPFDALAEQSRRLADSATSAWSRGGIAFETRIVDATGYPNAAEYQGLDVNACSAGLPERIGANAGRINVYYVGGIYHPEFDVRGQGAYCGDQVIVLSANDTRSPWLLGHEIGHAFGLGHEVEGNLMHAFGRGSHVTAGQIFRAHFHRGSAVNRILTLYGREQARDCGITWPVFPPNARCPPTTFDFQEDAR
ncbi:MAG TPA: hypothetical protein VF006_30535 [Longimicrobium sp.]